MDNEMLPADIFTQPRREWQATIYIKKWLSKDDDLTPEQITAIGKMIAKTLRATPLFDDEDVIENFEQVDDLEEFNSILDDMYDECDRVRIWVK